MVNARALLAWGRARWIPLGHILICASVVAPIAARPGWPAGHDVYPLFERVEAFRREFAAGDLLPLWTPFSFNGHGSPMPLLYHRLFDSVAGVLAVVLGTPAAVKATVVLVLILGASGMSAAARELGCVDWIRFWSGAALVLAHYTFTNWLVRGAAAELTAGMVIPWLVSVCLRIQSTQPFGVRLGATLVLLFHAHMAIFLYALPLMTAAALCRLLVPPRGLRTALGYLARSIGVALAIVAVGAVPFALAVAYIGREFNLARLAMYVPQRQMVAVSRYFLDDFPWGHDWRGFSVEIGRFAIAALVLIAALAIAGRARIRLGARALAFLATSVAAYFWFQLPMAAAFFERVPLAQVLQFPWRLLVFVTPLALLLLATLTHGVFELGGAWSYAAVAALAGTLTAEASVAMTALRADYEWLRPETLAAILTNLDSSFGAGEFLPKELADRPVPPRAALFRWEGEGCELVSSSVDLSTLGTVPFETVRLALQSPNGCTVHFSQFATALVDVRASEGGRLVKADDATTDVVLPPGPAEVRVARRGLVRALAYAVRRP